MKVERLPALRTGHLYLQEIFLVLVSVSGSVDPRAIVWPEEFQWHPRESNQRPSDLWRSTSTNSAPALLRIYFYGYHLIVYFPLYGAFCCDDSIPRPPYSPDLIPGDCSLWAVVIDVICVALLVDIAVLEVWTTCIVGREKLIVFGQKWCIAATLRKRRTWDRICTRARGCSFLEHVPHLCV